MKVTSEIEHELLAIEVKWPSSFPIPGTDNIGQQLVDGIHIPTNGAGDNILDDNMGNEEPSTVSEEELMEIDNSEEELEELDNAEEELEELDNSEEGLAELDHSEEEIHDESSIEAASLVSEEKDIATDNPSEVKELMRELVDMLVNDGDGTRQKRDVGLDNTDALKKLLEMLTGDSKVDAAISNVKDKINELDNELKQGNMKLPLGYMLLELLQ